MMATKISVALLGAGIWARKQHLPAILENPAFDLKAIYSRSKSSVEKLASEAPGHVDTYYDEPPTGSAGDNNRTLHALLARNDISAVVVCVPILVQLDLVRRCLEAGKHVQSEKPIAGDTATAAQFINWFRDAQRSGVLRPGLVWAVAEEFRLLPGIELMRSQVSRLGAIQMFTAQGFANITPGSPFFETAWRKVPGYQGGFLLDGGVHYTSALLHVLGQANRPTCVVAFSTLLRDYLQPVDTLNAIVRLENGVSGIFSHSAGIAHKPGPTMYFEFVCEQGSVSFESGAGINIVRIREGGSEETEQFDSKLNSRYEAALFAKSIQQGKEEIEEAPERALNDLELLEKMLLSGQAGGAVRKLNFVN
ncbi:hypothetical protein F5884DRAFT_840237 [Xylogone sp. PMI_703]|nr:hypothetical protein F5884DRAFT_840237 [Xylogone sp. PMI_703]